MADGQSALDDEFEKLLPALRKASTSTLSTLAYARNVLMEVLSYIASDTLRDSDWFLVGWAQVALGLAWEVEIADKDTAAESPSSSSAAPSEGTALPYHCTFNAATDNVIQKLKEAFEAARDKVRHAQESIEMFLSPHHKPTSFPALEGLEIFATAGCRRATQLEKALKEWETRQSQIEALKGGGHSRPRRGSTGDKDMEHEEGSRNRSGTFLAGEAGAGASDRLFGCGESPLPLKLPHAHSHHGANLSLLQLEKARHSAGEKALTVFSRP